MFEWDEYKREINLLKHGIDFEEAKEIFSNHYLSTTDKRFEYGEERWISIGTIKDIVVVVVVHTNRINKIRIISARLANKKEREAYYEHIKKKTR